MEGISHSEVRGELAADADCPSVKKRESRRVFGLSVRCAPDELALGLFGADEEAEELFGEKPSSRSRGRPVGRRERWLPVSMPSSISASISIEWSSSTTSGSSTVRQVASMSMSAPGGMGIPFWSKCCRFTSYMPRDRSNCRSSSIKRALRRSFSADS